MSITNNQALTMLLDALREDKESDITSILEAWRTAVDVREELEQAQRAAQMPPQRYGLLRGVTVQVSSDSSHQFFQFQPTERLVIDRADIAEFARSRGLSLDRLMSVLDGHVQEYQGYRSFWFHGGLSKPYEPPKEKMSDEERKQEAGKRYTPGQTSFVPVSSEPAYSAMPEPVVQIWQPSQKEQK